ncbi:S41 family peptidase [Pedobacter nutrimenti]|jgi:C-terminal processing protease CtpA/Prc|nr:S41 family peptidase [Pedobacter nutrimenti]
MKLFLLKKQMGWYLLFVLAITAGSCKKNNVEAPAPGGGGGGTTTPPVAGTRMQLTLDSLFLYAKDIYYWNDALPSYDVFNPRGYSSSSVNLTNYNSELFAISQLKINPATGKPYEYRTSNPSVPKYSRIEDNTLSNAQQSSADASVGTDNIGYDMGFLFFQGYGPSDNNYVLYVGGVYANSPAANAGITRGTIISKINGASIGTDFANESVVMNNITSNKLTTATFSGTRTDGTKFDNLSLSVTKYTSTPIYKSAVVNQGGKKIGYLAYARFSTLSNPDSRNPSDVSLDPIFANFASNGITDLVVDLRYNGGGSVQTAEYLMNLIIPSSASGVLYKEYYNPTMQAGNAKILVNQPLTDGAGKIIYSNGRMLTYADVNYSEAGNTYNISKKGSLTGIQNLIFIVSGNTASASELVINCLKPYVNNVKLIGTTTYGKPVGFFPIVLENRYTVYMPNFETKNSRGEGGYYAGFTPDFPAGTGLYDDSTHDFGDVNESYFKKALSILSPAPATVSSLSSTVTINNRAMSTETLKQMPSNGVNTKFNGMVETRHRLK